MTVLADLWHLLRLSGSTGLRDVWASVLLMALAAVADAASLALLKNSVSGPLAAGTSMASGGLRVIILFLLAAMVGTLLRLWALRRTAIAQMEVNRSLALRAFSILQHQEYTEYLRRGASEGFSAFERLLLISTYGLNSLILGSAAFLSIVVLLVGIAILYPFAAALLTGTLLLVIAEAIWRGQRSPPAMLSQLANERSVLLFEGRTAFRDIFLTNSQDRICADFAEAESKYRMEQYRMAMASQSSRHTIEIAGILTALLVLTFFSLGQHSDVELTALLAVTALAIFRLLPLVASLRSAFRLISLHADVSTDVRELLERPVATLDDDPPMKVELQNSLILRDVSFAREDRPDTLIDLGLEIARGMRIGIFGESGSGKSSLLDIICGAVPPAKGVVLVDDAPIKGAAARAWRNRIGIVSQNPVLLGSSLRDAIVYPATEAEIDPSRFDEAIGQAGVAEMAANFPKGLDTPVGEVASSLSGGQRQRLALARALYRAKDLLVLDEATGQLDDASEAAIIAHIEKLPRDLTIIIASHRRALFAICDQTFQLSEGKLVRGD